MGAGNTPECIMCAYRMFPPPECNTVEQPLDLSSPWIMVEILICICVIPVIRNSEIDDLPTVKRIVSTSILTPFPCVWIYAGESGGVGNMVIITFPFFARVPLVGVIFVIVIRHLLRKQRVKFTPYRGNHRNNHLLLHNTLCLDYAKDITGIVHNS